MNLLDLLVTIGLKDEASDKIDGISNRVKSGFGNAAAVAGKAIAAATAVAAAGTVAFGKMALGSYANYEQLAGGVAKLYGNASMSVEEYAASVGKSVDKVSAEWERNEQAQALMMDNAQKAYQTAGMSANQYMEQATSFSAALINSLGGDTVKAAELTDVAMRAMSDNINTFGSSAESVQDAFQGFAKQNYTMLDNLKLGYGGTKEEMERLIADANEWGAANGKASNLSIDSFADVVTAIEQIQEKQGIAGTTAKEAATTIEGSINMTKAAWQNLLAEFGKDDGDVGKRVTELVESAKTALLGSIDETTGEVRGGILPRVQTIVRNASGAIKQSMPLITDTIYGVMPYVVSAVSDLLPLILEALVYIILALAQELPGLIMSLIPVIISLVPTIVEAALQLFMGLVEALSQAAPEVISALVDMVFELIDVIIDHSDELVVATLTFLGALVTAILQKTPEIVQKLIELVVKLVRKVIDSAPEMLRAAVQFLYQIVVACNQAVTGVLSAIGNLVWQAVSRIASAVGDMLRAAQQWFSGLQSGAGQAVNGFLGWVSGIPGWILRSLGNLGGLLWNAGSSIIGGLWDGMVSQARGLFNWVSGIANTIASLKGPLPYDKKVLIENGEALIDGLETGLQTAFEGNVIPFVSGMADEMSNALGTGSIDVGGTATAQRAQSAPIINININVENMQVRDDSDIDMITEKLYSKIRREIGGAPWKESYSVA